MSAVLDTLKKGAVRREASGFSTMYGDPLVAQSADYTSTVSHTFVGSDMSVGSGMVIAYSIHSAPHQIGFSDLQAEPKVFAIRSDNFLVRSLKDAATMGAQGSVWIVEAIEPDERGVVVLNMPRKRIHTDVITVRTADLPRRQPRIVLSARLDEEDNA